MSSVFRNFNNAYRCTIQLATLRMKTGKNVYESNFSDYSVVLGRCIDSLDIFIDILLKRNNEHDVISRNKSNESNAAADVNLTEKLNSLLEVREDTTKICDNYIRETLRRKCYIDTYKIIDFCKNNKVIVPTDTLTMLAHDFVQAGSKTGLVHLKNLCRVINPKEYLKQEKYLLCISKVSWTNNNMKDCIKFLNEYCEQFPSETDKVKPFLGIVIEKTVKNQSEAQLRTLVDFIKYFCAINNDFHMLATLWMYLFQSDWFTDQQLANQLVNDNAHLKQYIQLISVPLSKRLLFRGKNNRLSELLQELLRLNMTEQYQRITIIMFDYYRKYYLIS